MKEQEPTYQDAIKLIQSKLDETSKDVARTSINDPKFPKMAVRHDVLSELVYELTYLK